MATVEASVKKKLIFIVDDDTALSQLYQDVLEQQGYQVLTARNAEEALTLIVKAELPALILVDCLMPRVSGAQFIKAAQTIRPELARYSRIVGYSSLSPQSPLTSEMRDLVHEIVEKPISIDELTHLVERLLSPSK